MNTAIIIAGGVGARTGQHVPKQFINVLDKPIIVYTLERFQCSDIVDGIEVVCLDGWQEILWAYARQFGIAKLKWVVTGGESCQESIYKGLENLNGICNDDDIVVIHDGIRPMVEEDIISSCIETCKSYGNGISALPVYEQVFCANSERSTTKYIPREKLRILQTPQAYKYRLIFEIYKKAFLENRGLHDSSYANTLMADMGEMLYFSKGSTKNIKITSQDDIAIFKAMLKAGQKNEYE